ncbi:T9SS type A sorting domain-containing protein [candidate division KSB1 bacterium]|nr:T9SS type A sorting domain-containing protein [candidate division KSB1 bacterium]
MSRFSKKTAALFTVLVPIFAMAENLIITPECVSYDSSHHRYLVSCFTTGSIVQIDSSGNQSYFRSSLGRCLSHHIHKNVLYLCRGKRVSGYNLDSGLQVMDVTFEEADQVDGITSDNRNNLYVLEYGGSMFKIKLSNSKYTVFVDKGLARAPQDLLFDEANNRLIVCAYYNRSPIQEVSLADSSVRTITVSSIGNFDGLARDRYGYYYLTSWGTNAVHRYDPDFTEPPMTVSTGHEGPANLCCNVRDEILAVPNFDGNRVDFIDISPAGYFKVDSVFFRDTDNDWIYTKDENLEIRLTLSNIINLDNIKARLTCRDSSIVVLDSLADFSDMVDLSTGNDSPFLIKVQNDHPGRNVRLQVDIFLHGKKATTKFLNVFVGRGDILLVDDDQDENVEEFYSDALKSFGLSPHFWETARRRTPPMELLVNFSTLFWFTGTSDSTTLTSKDQRVLGQFLDNGGCLFLSGQGIGQDIGSEKFYKNYLHARKSDTPWHSSYLIKGNDDPLSQGIFTSIRGGDGADNQIQPTAVEPDSAARSIFTFIPGNTGAGIVYEGDYRIVYFGFGFEAVNKQSTREDIIRRILQFFGFPLAVHGGFSQLPTIQNLFQNYPNPFNSQTAIRFVPPNGEKYRLSIYDTMGRLVKTLSSGQQGTRRQFTVIWDGTDTFANAVGSGVYYCRLETSHFYQTRKILLLK